jgi:hypothetical protein
LNWTSAVTTFLRGKRPPRIDPRQLEVDDHSLETALTQLRTDRSGVAFIYSAMDLFVARYELNDLVVVFQDSDASTQIFRWGARPISPERTLLINAAPGVYCYPNLDDTEDVNLLFVRCTQAFIDRHYSDESSTGILAPRPFPKRPDQESSRVDAELGDLEGSTEAEDPQVGGSRFGVETWRVFASKVFVCIAVADALLALFNVTGSIRFVLGLVLGLAIPGWSIVGLIHFRDTALEISLSVAASIAIVMVSGQLLITLHFWHLELFEVLLCLICLPSLLHQAKWYSLHAWRRR